MNKATDLLAKGFTMDEIRTLAGRGIEIEDDRSKEQHEAESVDIMINRLADRHNTSVNQQTRVQDNYFGERVESESDKRNKFLRDIYARGHEFQFNDN